MKKRDIDNIREARRILKNRFLPVDNPDGSVSEENENINKLLADIVAVFGADPNVWQHGYNEGSEHIRMKVDMFFKIEEIIDEYHNAPTKP